MLILDIRYDLGLTNIDSENLSHRRAENQDFYVHGRGRVLGEARAVRLFSGVV